MVLNKGDAFVYLTANRTLPSLREGLSSLFTYFNDQFRYPIILFHDDLNETQALSYLGAKLAQEQLCLVEFIVVEMKIPGEIDVEEAKKQHVEKFAPSRPFLSYSVMIDFWVRQVFEQPRVKQLKYFARLDSDSLLGSPIQYDMFQMMHIEGFRYGYRVVSMDGPSVTYGMWPFVKEFVDNNTIVPKSKIRWPIKKKMFEAHVPVYYNNFEIVHVPTALTSPVWRTFTEAVVKSQNIYFRRWGDAPLRWFAAKLSLEEKEVHMFCDWNYHHHEWYNQTCAAPL